MNTADGRSTRWQADRQHVWQGGWAYVVHVGGGGDGKRQKTPRITSPPLQLEEVCRGLGSLGAAPLVVISLCLRLLAGI
jgi:hypothetical protein